MTPAEYERVREVFIVVCDMPLHQRRPYIEDRFVGEPDLMAEVSSLLEYDGVSINIDGAFASWWESCLRELRSPAMHRDSTLDAGANL
jgi:hypothetical protein